MNGDHYNVLAYPLSIRMQYHDGCRKYSRKC